MLLRPSDFKHVPPSLRPRRTVRVNRHFGSAVKNIKKFGGRSDSGEVGDVMMVLNDMRRKTPKIFVKRTMKKRKTK